ncbi:MAG: hypothetical protein V2A79_15135 [Planctomycetota bacterium]
MDELNLVKNPRFALGRKAPRSWRWSGDGPATRWRHEPSVNGRAEQVMRLESEHSNRSAGWSQTLRCKPGQTYRLEADVACECNGTEVESGLVLSIHYHADEGPTGETLRFAAVRHVAETLTLRGYFQPPPVVHSVEVRIGMVQASGWARVYALRLMPILEVDACSHVLAVPPPVYAEPPPRSVERVAVYGDAASCPSLLEVLRLRLGSPNVQVHTVGTGALQTLEADALVIPGDRPPADLRTVTQLEALARNRIVILSIGAFARLVRPPLAFRTVEQADDPMHAKVTSGCFLTRGFALHDVFPFAGVGSDPTGFAQRQWVANRAWRDFRKRHGFEVFLTAVTNRDQTMDQPIGLYKPTRQGAVVVCDLDVLERPPTTLGEVHAAAVLLLNMLGRAPVVLGQYVAPARGERDFRQELVEFCTRFEAYRCTGLEHSDTSVEGVVIRLGPEEASCGLSPAPRPAVVIRTGLRTGDDEGLYGTLLWLKRLVRPLPTPCAYARYLGGRFRIVWLPLQRPWNDAIGMSLMNGAPRRADPDFGSGPTRTLVDLTTGAEQRLRVIFDRAGALFERCARALPALARALDPDRFIGYAPAPGTSPGRFDAHAWRRLDLRPEVVVEAASFRDRVHATARAAGADLVRLELPRALTDLTADSLWRTDVAACTLEHIVGQICDTFVMNHLGRPLELDATDIFGGSCDQYHLVRTDPQTGEDRAERRRVKSDPVIRLMPGTAVCE